MKRRTEKEWQIIGIVGKWLGSGWEVVGVFFFQLLPDS
jgi:hypothetical protein